MIRELLRSNWANYSIAILFTLAALALTTQLPLRDSVSFLLFFLAIVASARYAGIGPALLAIALAVLATDYFFIPPINYLDIENPDDAWHLGAFAFVAILASVITAAYVQSRQFAAVLAHRQALVAQLAESAINSPDLSQLFVNIAPSLCKSFNADRAGIFEYLQEKQSLALLAGCGWDEGIIPSINLAAESWDAQALLSSEPQIFFNSDKAKTVRLSNFFINHQLRSGMRIAIQDDAQPFGIVGIYYTQPRKFQKHDLDFLKIFSGLLTQAMRRVRTDFQLRERYANLQNTVASLADGVIAVDSQGAVTRINAMAQSLTGWNETDSIAQPLDRILKVVDEKSEQPVQTLAAVAMQSGSVSKLETRAVLIDRDGKRISIDAIAAPLRDASRQVTGAVISFRDTTVSRQIEETIRRSEERLRVALKNSPVVVFNQDLNLRYTWVLNPARGFPDQAVVGKTDADLMSWSEVARWTEVKQNVIQTKVGTRVELSATVEGQRRTFDLTIEPLLDRDEKIIGITCASIDITERKREQAAISRLAAIVESSDDAIVGKTLDGIILSWNPGAERMYGYDPDEIIGQSVSILYPADRLNEFRDITEQLKHGEPVKQHDTVLVRKDGTLIDVSVAVSLVRDGMGRVIGASSITRDITERKALLVENARLVEELHQANEALEQRVAKRTNQLQDAVKKLEDEIIERRRATEQLRQLSAHLQSAREEERIRVAREIHDELGQVLTVVKMDLSLLERNLNEQNDKNVSEELIAQIHATSQLVDDSIQKMREIIRELRPGVLDHLGLKSAIEWQAQEFQAHTGIECHVHTGDEEISLDLDRSTAIFRIFQETLTNVARHAQATRIDVRLEMNDHLTLEVRDNGKGISESDIVDGKSFGILGIRERALMVGGEVDVRGETGKGTTIRVRIPLERRHD